MSSNNGSRARICFLGNSHIAALKTGWDSMAEADRRADVTFFGSARRGLNKLRLRRRVLSTTDEKVRSELAFTSGGEPRIAVDHYDVFVLVGLYFGRSRMLRTMRDHRTVATRGATTEHLVSDAVADATCAHQVASCLAFRLAQRIQLAYDGPLLLVEEPMPRTSVGTDQPGWLDVDLLAERFGPIWDEQATKGVEALGVQALYQPPETKLGHLTRDEYGAGAIRLLPGMDTAHRPEDHAHMNAAYGRLVLNQVFDHLDL